MCNVDGQAGALQGLSKLKLSLAFIENVIGLNNLLKALNRAQQKVVENLFSVQAYRKPRSFPGQLGIKKKEQFSLRIYEHD